MVTERSIERLAESAAQIAGAESIRLATAADIIDSAQPLLVISPRDGVSAGALLAWASRERLSVAIKGAGTKIAWGPPLRGADLIVSTLRLNRVTDHRHGDLTATVQAGVGLMEANRQLARHGQWIPLDPFHEAATIGGILAVNDSGPRRHRYGAPRDLIIGITIARPDGRLARSGGIVVKNVAGYDMARLVTGSYGSLGLIVDATFKLAPLPKASRTVIVTAPAARLLTDVLAGLMSSQTMPTAMELELPPGRILVRFETTESSAAEQSRQIVDRVGGQGASAEIVSHDLEAGLWRAHAARPWSKPGTVLKISALPSQLASLCDSVAHLSCNADWELVGRAGVGVLLLRVDSPEAEQPELVSQLRARFKSGDGHVTVLRASAALKMEVDAIAVPDAALGLMQTIKRQFDPADILNPGRI